MKKFTASENERDMRISRFVERITHDFPKSMMYKSFRNKRVKVNGKRVEAEYRICPGDVIELYINDEFFWNNLSVKPALDISSNPVTLDIVYQDENCAIIFKPSGVLSHSSKNQDSSILDSFINLMVQNGEYSPQNENQFVPALCNRLDRGTEGLVIAAKNRIALRYINELMQHGFIKRQYLCITSGVPDAGTYSAFLCRDKANHTVAISEVLSPGFKPITTVVEVLENTGTNALCEITLITGRTHQIRAHLAYLGYPVIGDRKYGSPSLNNSDLKLKTQALCSYKISFENNLPKTNTLHYLDSRVFEANNCNVLSCWNKIKHQ